MPRPPSAVPEPDDADLRRAARPVVSYPDDSLPGADLALYGAALATAEVAEAVTVPPREARCLRVPAGAFLRIVSVEGPQVGDLNLWNAERLEERFFSGKSRALHGTHVTRGHRLWSVLPWLRPMATIVADDLEWYGFDADGGGVHDVIGTRCDPYTNRLLSGDDYHHCCHSNLVRALSEATGLAPDAAEPLVHDVLNVFMCTGFTHDTHQYFMKASPVRPGDALTLFAEIDLVAGLSACPGGDCSASHSSDAAACHPLRMEVLRPDPATLSGWASPPVSAYDRSHGLAGRRDGAASGGSGAL